MLLLDIFCDWFEGSWSNRNQAYSNPKAAAYVIAKHTRTYENQFHCEYYYHKNKKPYREMYLDLHWHDSDIVLRNGPATMTFQVVHGSFICDTSHVIADKKYNFRAALTQSKYLLNDQCYDNKGSLIRGLPDKEWYEFSKSIPSS